MGSRQLGAAVGEAGGEQAILRGPRCLSASTAWGRRASARPPWLGRSAAERSRASWQTWAGGALMGRRRAARKRLRQQVDAPSGARVVFVHEEGAQERFLTQEEHRANRPVEEDQKELTSLQECVLDLEAVIEDKLQKRRLQQS